MFFRQIYNTIDVQVALVGMEIWSDGDKIKIVPNIGDTFNNFLNWHRSNLGKMKRHDHAQLLRWAYAGQGRVYVGKREELSQRVLARDFCSIVSLQSIVREPEVLPLGIHL